MSPDRDSQAPVTLLANLRHGLRTPLNAILGYSEIMMEDAQDLAQDEFMAHLREIHSAGKRLLVIVNETLSAERIQASQEGLDLGFFERELRERLSEPLGVVISRGGKLLNLFEGGGHEDLIPDLQRIRSSADRLLTYTGDLGRCLAETGGSLTQDSGEPPPQGEAPSPSQTGGMLLVVDDNEINRHLLSSLLARQRHRTMVAENGAHAFEMLRSHTFDLVLLDVIMPQMNGYHVLRELKSEENWRDIPVIMISALDEMDSVVRCIELGAEDYLSKPFDPVLLRARVGACLEKKRLRDQEREQKERLKQLFDALEVRNKFIKDTFGRYLSDEVVESILDTPSGLNLGGEKRVVTIMITDLRGFTSISERLPPEDVVRIINIYLEAMTEIILKYQGTIDEFIGDSILVLFGAPIGREDDAARAVACAVEMQLAMPAVNARNRALGYPEVSMGIGIATGSTVVGNIGSAKRAKYGVVGRNVNLASRIESYTVGGQIFICECTRETCGVPLRVEDEMRIMPKGFRDPVRIYDIGGIGGDYKLFLPERKEQSPRPLSKPWPVKFFLLEGKHVAGEDHDGLFTMLTEGGAVMTTAVKIPWQMDIKITLLDGRRREITSEIYGKVTQAASSEPDSYLVHFTSLPPDAQEALSSLGE